MSPSKNNTIQDIFTWSDEIFKKLEELKQLREKQHGELKNIGN